SHNDPANHSLSDVGLMYELNEEDQSQTVLKYNPGFTKRFISEADALNKFCIMVRKPGLEVVNYLKHADYSAPVNRYLLYGPQGCGKTMTMLYAISYCRKQGWLIFPAFNTWSWLKYKKEIVRSQWNKERVDHSEVASRWLENFRQINSHLLDKIYTTREYVWTKYEKSEAGISFASLVDQGIARVRIASDVIGCIIREVLQQDDSNFPRSLVAVDCVNSFFSITTLKIEPGIYVEPNELTMVYNFKKLLRNRWKNGAVVVGLNTSGIQNQTGRVENITSEHPHDILGPDGFDWLDPHIPIHVPLYTDIESISQLAYYQDRKWLVGRSISEAGEAEILQICGNSPNDISVYCGHL
uniref:Small ribosomal subunit protein mS29 n=1 Tax=Ciona savignyi TaxID=51511 RepID=H2YCC1_CIOSA